MKQRGKKHDVRDVNNLLLPLEALRRVRFFSRPRPFSAPSLAEADFSFPRCLLLSSSFLFVGEGALLEQKRGNQMSACAVNAARRLHKDLQRLRLHRALDSSTAQRLARQTFAQTSVSLRIRANTNIALGRDCKFSHLLTEGNKSSIIE